MKLYFNCILGALVLLLLTPLAFVWDWILAPILRWIFRDPLVSFGKVGTWRRSTSFRFYGATWRHWAFGVMRDLPASKTEEAK